MNDELEQRLRAAFATRLESVSPEREARLRAFVDHPQRRPRPAWPTMATAATGLAAAVVAVVALLSSGTESAFAGWTRTPSRATAGALASVRSACGNVAGHTVLESDARGPYTAIIYTRDGSPWQCVTEGRQVFLNQSTTYPPSVLLSPPAGKVTLPMISRTVSGAKKVELTALRKRAVALDNRYARFANTSYPKTFIRQDDNLQQKIYAIETGPGSLTAVSGSIGVGVIGVTFVLSDGTKVRATVGHGWYLAWWPGSSRQSAPDPASILVTTVDGTERVAYGSSSLRRSYGPCLVNACWGPGQPSVRVGFAAGLKRKFTLFSKTKPTPARDVAAVDLKGLRSFVGRTFGIDESQMREVSFGGNGIILVIPGNEAVCVKRTFPPSIDAGGNGGGCSPLSTVMRQGVMAITDGTTLVGLVPNGNKTVTVHFASGRKTSVAVKDNAVLAVFDSAPKFVTYKNSEGLSTRWP